MALKNVSMAFPENSPSENNDLIKQCFRHFGMVFTEFLRMPALNSENINNIVEKKDYSYAKEISSTIESLSSSLLISQTKAWIDSSDFSKFEKYFSCKNEKDILIEFMNKYPDVEFDTKSLEKYHNKDIKS